MRPPRFFAPPPMTATFPPSTLYSPLVALLGWVSFRIHSDRDLFAPTRGGRRMVGRAVDAADLPDDVLAFLDQHLLDLGGTYGDPEAGEPVQAFRREELR